MNGSTVLVTGGAGFLGSHLCESLVEDGHEVICVDNFGSGRRENISDIVSDRFTVIEGDVREKLTLPPVDAIYHLASRASPTDFTKYPVRIALTNTTGTRQLLDHAVACDAQMVFASTSEVYGDPKVHPQPEHYTGNVNIRGPRGCYDESKRFSEALTVTYEEKYDLDVRTARIFNTYGPRMRADDGRVVPTFITQALCGDDLTIYGDGSQTRSFCYVSDTVTGLRALMQTDGLQGEVVNIGRSNEISIEELAETVRGLCDTTSGVSYEPKPTDDPKRRKPDLTKAKRLLGWRPVVGLETGLERTISYFQD
jgi:UDP-glucuronate decarboxylase